ncbi:thiamine diphosphokinase [Peptococcaceae bacterium 1198_IL3148]
MLVILAGGEINNYQELKKVTLQADYIICADGGARHAYRMKVIPDVIIGDMDSLNPAILDYFKNKDIEIIRYPSEKDEVDTELAIRQGIKLGFKEMILLGATGGRLDHTLANIHLLIKAAQLATQVKIVDEHHRLYLVTPQLATEINGVPGQIVSLIPLTEKVKGVYTQGLKWELHNGTFAVGNPFGVSNQLTSNQARIKISEGILLVIEIISEEKQSGS